MAQPQRARTLTSRPWHIAPAFAGCDDLARRLGTAPLIAQMLHNRGIADEAAGGEFLNPRLSLLHDPLLMAGCEAAANRLAKAIADRQRIVLYGDYDVDGITGLAILQACIKMLGGTARRYVPHRLDEGYGLNAEAVSRLLAEGMDLLVTVDCGVTAMEPVAQLRAGGCDVIITDHHTPGPALPDALAIVHPNLPGQDYPNKHLAGAGVAFKLAWQLARTVCGNSRVDETMKQFLVEATCLAALGTIADLVPLVGENRCIATHGLRGLGSCQNPGVRALLESNNLLNERLDAYHVGFVLAPRLNAAGRMGHAELAVELLTEAQGSRCAEIAAFLDQQNAQRQKTEREIATQAIDMAVAAGLDSSDRRSIVLSSGDWHGGVIGIVASRLVDRFAKPTILVCFNGDDVGQGSGRSIAGFNLVEALSACGDHLESFGGHAMAGGVRVRRDKIDAFAEAFELYARGAISDGMLAKPLTIDAQATLADISYKVAQHVAKLAPFGQGNPPPLLAIHGCQVINPPRRMGRTGQAVSMMLGQNGSRLRAVGFGMGDLADLLVGVNEIDIVCEPVLNSFNGNTSVELRIKDVAWGEFNDKCQMTNAK